jgi:hypothetical protein
VSGPGALPWALALLALAAATLPLGEVLRSIGARWSGLLRCTDPIERGLVDLYLAGASLYLVGVVPFGLFTPFTPVVLLVGGAVAWFLLRIVRLRTRSRPYERPLEAGRLLSVPVLLVLLATLALFAIEVSAAVGAPTGNTFDSSVLVDFVARTTATHSFPTTLSPIAPVGVAYPQGSTAWIATAQYLFALPPPRAPLLLTPLFLALAPLAGYVWGRRCLGSPAGGLAFGLFFALLATWTRVLASGSNDFVFAFPLVLLLWSWAPRWSGPALPSWPDAIAWGALAGYSAALNPTGAQLLFLVLPVFALLSVRPSVRGAIGWGTRWFVAALIALAWLAPSVGVLWSGRSSPGLIPGASAGAPHASALVLARVVGLTDPLLFGPTNVWWSPFLALRVELAVLLIVGIGGLVLPLRSSLGRGRAELGRFVLALTLVTIALFLLLSIPYASVPGLRSVASLTNALELSIWLFTGFGGIAAIPLAELIAMLAREWEAPGVRPESSSTPAVRRGPRSAHTAIPKRTAVAFLVVVALVGAGVAVTATQLPGYVGSIYGTYGNVSSADFALLAWAGSHLPSGARVLVAPGSAAEFLPGYVPSVRIIEPMLGIRFNATYESVIRALDVGDLSGALFSNLSALGVEYIAVTENNTALDAPFAPLPLVQDPANFPVLFQQGDAYLFAYAHG